MEGLILAFLMCPGSGMTGACELEFEKGSKDGSKGGGARGEPQRGSHAAVSAMKGIVAGRSSSL